MSKLFTSESVQGTEIVRLTFNEINREQREVLQGELKEIIGGAAKLVVDLSRVGFISSLLLATLVSLAQEVKLKNGQMKISGLSSEARSVFEITHLDKVFELFDTEDQALNSFTD